MSTSADELLRELEESDDEATIELCALALVEGPATADDLARLSEHEHAAVRRTAVLALERRGGPGARALLEPRLHDASERVRQDACRALATTGDAQAIGALAGALGDPRPGVRAAACDAISALAVALAAGPVAVAGGGCDAVEALGGLLREERVTTVRRQALEALTSLGRRDATVREAALGQVAAHVGREDSADLVAMAADRVVLLAEGRTSGELVASLRRVPASGRAALADALAARPIDPAQPLARLVADLRALAPDPAVLARFGSDLTARARSGVLPRAFGRERELKAIKDRLGRPGSRSLVLVGPSGAGKTAIVQELARQLAHEQVLVPMVVHEATTGEILSGTRYLGEWQTRLKELVEALRAPHRAVWYVPDLNRLVDAGATAHSDASFASELAPAVERGDLVLIGESTPEAFRRGLDRHPAFARLFLKVTVEPPDRAATLDILRRVADEVSVEHARRGLKVEVPENAIEAALDLAQDYFPSLARPGNGVHLLREAISAAADDHREALAAAEGFGVAGGSSAASSGGTEHGSRGASTGPESRTLSKGLSLPPAHGIAARPAGGSEERAPAGRAQSIDGPLQVSATRVLQTLSAVSGVPVGLLDDAVPLDPDAVRRFLAERVLGQDEATEAVVDLISLIKAELTDPTQPLGVLFFVGPTGVGKTEMAKAIAEFIFGSPERLVRIDLGEFKEADAHRRLVGDPQAVDPTARSGLLTAPVRERPFSVVLLDEVEKAHRNVFDLLLPLMAEGRLVDEQGRVTDFRRTIVVMTSNLGSDLREDSGLGFTSDAATATGKVKRVMEDTFRPEFLNRIGRTIVFAPLSIEVMRQLTRREVRRVLARRGITRRNVIVETDDSVIGILLKEGFSERYGARPLKRRVEELLLKPLARALLQLVPDEPEATIVRLGVRGDRVVSELIRPTVDVEDEAPAAPRATARVRDAQGRLVDADDLAATVTSLFDRVVALSTFLEGQRLRERKKELLKATSAPDFWHNRGRAGAILSEIAAIEQTLEAPARLEKRLARLEGLVARAKETPGESRALHDAVLRATETAHEVELTEYAVRCTSAAERGDAYVLLRRIDDEAFPAEDVIKRMARMLLRYGRRKGFTPSVVFESVTPQGVVREAGIKLEGMCAYGLLRGEEGLHHWLDRAETRRNRHTTFVRASVFAPAEEALKPGEVVRERRMSREETGALIKKHRLHLVLTHQPSLVAVDGGTDGGDDAEEEVLAFLAARVALARRGEPRDPGVVRRYVLSSQPMARDLWSGRKLPLDRVLDGELDDFILPRIMQTPPPPA